MPVSGRYTRRRDGQEVSTTVVEFRTGFTVVLTLFACLAVVSALSNGEVVDWPWWTLLVPIAVPFVLAFTGFLVAVLVSLRPRRRERPVPEGVKAAPAICGQCQQGRHMLCVRGRKAMCGCPVPHTEAAV